MKTSIIVPVHNQLRYTKQLLDVLLSVTPPDELIVVDNASTDGTAQYLQALAATHRGETHFVIAPRDQNYGFGNAMNYGIGMARGECLVLLSNDVRLVTADWLDEVRRAVAQYPNALFGAQVVTDNPCTLLTSGETLIYLAGWVLALSRETLHRLAPDGALFDERFGLAYYEDVDLSRRALGLGIRLHALPDLGLLHFGGKTAFDPSTTHPLGSQLATLRHARKAYADKWGVEWAFVKGLDE